MQLILPIGQIVVSIVLIVLVLLQQRGAALGSAFGGGDSGFYSTRRGAEKYIYWGTIVFAVAFIVLSILNLVY